MWRKIGVANAGIGRSSRLRSRRPGFDPRFRAWWLERTEPSRATRCLFACSPGGHARPDRSRLWSECSWSARACKQERRRQSSCETAGERPRTVAGRPSRRRWRVRQLARIGRRQREQRHYAQRGHASLPRAAVFQFSRSAMSL